MSQATNSSERPISIKDFAARSRLSVATVSRALRPETAHLVQEETRRLVQELAAKWNYSPNPQARSLRNPRHPMVTIILQDVLEVFQSDYYSRVLGGVLDAAETRQVETRIVLVGGTGPEFTATFRRRTAGSNAVLYLGKPLQTSELTEIARDPRPIIFYKNALPRDISADTSTLRVIGTDDAKGATLIAEHLLACGHRRFFLAGGPAAMRDAIDRENTLVARLRQEGIEIGPEDRTHVMFSVRGGREAWEEFARQERPATAVVCGSDEIAFGFHQAAQVVGRDREFTITGYDEHHLIKQLHVPITSVEHDLAAMGRASVELLLEALARPDVPPEPVWRLFPPRLIVR
ncbi:hypothetical protein IMCC26134_03510 [Verrucomicrobia bacterium IMCC26134]|nr:hypothetical protein IMCC26134_03510 [Verrucomicrobia bacterium IMCC26134]